MFLSNRGGNDANWGGFSALGPNSCGHLNFSILIASQASTGREWTRSTTSFTLLL